MRKPDSVVEGNREDLPCRTGTRTENKRKTSGKRELARQGSMFKDKDRSRIGVDFFYTDICRGNESENDNHRNCEPALIGSVSITYLL